MLYFGDGIQALHYFILCFAAILGVIQIAATQSNRRELLWLDTRLNFFLGAIMIIASFGWFLSVDEEIFVPGLAGSEIIAIFLGAFAVAVAVTRIVAFLASLYPHPNPLLIKERELAPSPLRGEGWDGER